MYFAFILLSYFVSIGIYNLFAYMFGIIPPFSETYTGLFAAAIVGFIGISYDFYRLWDGTHIVKFVLSILPFED